MDDLIGHTLCARYRIDAFLGRGGMAEVYKAWDTQRNYHVALKILREDLAEDREFDQRFRREADALARLAHRNIVRFYSFERESEMAFIVMDYVPGITLRRLLFDAGGPLPPAQVQNIVEQVVMALAYAHSLGVIHRDVKPGNVMIQPDGHVLLSDFGIARAVDDVTMTMVMPGTPAYMSPEQCQGAALDLRTDVYSLGVVVYEMIAARRPFRGESDGVGTGTSERTRWEQIHLPPPSPRLANPQISWLVETVVMRALAKDPDARFATVMEFWEALKPALSSAATSQPTGSQAQSAIPLPMPPAVPQPGSSRTPAASLLPSAGEPDAMAPATRSRPPKARLASLPPWAWVLVGMGLALFLALAVALFTNEPWGEGDSVSRSGMGQVRAATPTSTPSSRPTSTPLPTFALTTTSTPTSLPVPLPVRSGTPVPRASAVISPGNASQVIALARWGRGMIRQFAYSPDGDLLAVASSAGVILYDGESLEEKLWIETGARVSSLAFSLDGQVLATGSDDGTVRLWRVSDGALLHILEGHTDWVRSVAISPDGQVLASGSWDNTVRLWWVGAGTLLRTLEGHTHYVFSVAFSPDGQTLASGSYDNTVRLWRVTDGALLRTLEGHTHYVFSVAFSPDGQTLASGSYDNTVRLWRVSDGTVLRTLEGHTDYVRSVAFSPDGQVLASGSDDNTVRLWQVRAGTLLRTLEGHTHYVFSVVFSPDGQTLASGPYDNTVRLWRVTDGALLRTLEGYTDPVLGVAFGPDGQTVAAGSDSDIVQMWRVSDGMLLRTLDGPSSSGLGVAFSADGQTWASGSDDGPVWLWRVSDGALLRTLEGHSDRVQSVAFTPDGQVLASGSEDDTVRLWQVSDGTLVCTLEGHTDTVESVAFSPDGRVLVSGSDDGTVRLWGIEP